MSGRTKFMKALAAAIAACALLAIALPHLGFEVCEPPMHCYYSYMAEFGTGVAIIVAAVCMALSKGMEAPRMLAAVSAVSGVFMIMYPTTLIGVCGSPKMACHYGLLPVWNITGGLVILLSAAVFITSKEDRA